MKSRFYRRETESLEHSLTIRYRSSDVWVSYGGGPDPERMREALSARQQEMYNTLEMYMEEHRYFLTSLHPVPYDEEAPDIIRTMIAAGFYAGTGPMAAVAGTFAQEIGELALALGAQEVLVENGGDLYLNTRKDLQVGIYPGEDSVLREKLALEIPAGQMPLGLCTATGTYGHSFSFGKADALAVLSHKTALADALATAICNRVELDNSLVELLEEYREKKEILGILAVRGEEVVSMGDLRLIRPEDGADGKE